PAAWFAPCSSQTHSASISFCTLLIRLQLAPVARAIALTCSPMANRSLISLWSLLGREPRRVFSDLGKNSCCSLRGVFMQRRVIRDGGGGTHFRLQPLRLRRNVREEHWLDIDIDIVAALVIRADQADDDL